MWFRFKTPLLFGLALAVAAAHAQQEFRLSRDDWPSVRTGAAVVALPPVRDAVQSMEQLGDGRLRIRYPGGTPGTAWAFELREWLIALGVDSHRISLEPASGSRTELALDVFEAAAR